MKIKLSIRVKILVSIIISLLVSPTIAIFIDKWIQRINVLDSSFSVYISTGINLFVVSTIIMVLVNILILKPLKKVIIAADKLAQGDIDVDVKQRSSDEIGELMSAFGKMVDNIAEQSQNADKISKGDLTVKVVPKSENDVLANSMKQVVKTLKELVSETSTLTEEALQGNLSVRGHVDKFEGGYQDIVSGINKTLDAIINPLNAAADYIYRISDGDIPEKITETFNGDFNDLKDNINKCIEAIDRLVKDTDALVDATVEGKLNTRADANMHKGDYAKIVSGINNTLDAVVKPIQEASEVLEEMAKGNMSAKVEGAYKGDHAKIKNALNDTGEAIKGYLGEISDILSKMANRDFTVEITRAYMGDFILLKDSINHIVNQFNIVLNEIIVSSEQVESGAEQVASSSQNLSQGSSEQAASVEEISASITEMLDQTKENAENANKANELSTKAKADAQNGNIQMDEMLKAMTEIKNSSMNISNIIKVIDEIAFQTNILALNAAVEAARAGEHGKGFAVVAEEVRNLAERSAKAAKETTDLIDNSINKVTEGYKIANDTAEALRQIVEGVSNAVEIVGVIADASIKQANGIREINQSVDQISQVTQTNTATAEQSASTSEKMAGEAQGLMCIIQEFKVKNSNKSLISASKETIMIDSPNEANNHLKISLNEDNFGKY